MAHSGLSDQDYIQLHREVWEARPELRAVYQDFFRRILEAVEGRSPVVELGSGPGFFKQFHPELIATDVTPSDALDVLCDGCVMPFPSGSIGCLVMLDVLHHLPQPLSFLAEASRVLKDGGRVVMIEPWITPASYVLYRYFHHEDCTLSIDVRKPFESTGKQAFDGNATIPYKVVQYQKDHAAQDLRLVKFERFLGLPYLATLGFKRRSPLPGGWIDSARTIERLLGSVGRWNSTRALLVWEKAG